MAEGSWLDLSGFVCVSWGRGCRQQLPPPSPAGLPCARRARSPGTAIVRLHKCPSVCLSPPPLCCLSPDPTGVARQGAGWGPGCLSLRVPSLILFPMALSAPLLLRQRASPPPPLSGVSSSFIKQAFVKCLCVSGDVFLCYVSGLGHLLLGLLPLSGPWKLMREQSPAEAVPSCLLSPMARNPLSPHVPAQSCRPHDPGPSTAYDSAPRLGRR